ncbi:uncharacterized protein LOC130737628 [Lotus japonicus]|uniref:uncharacterized protein LOC130737628 n=1 Tax=Lotus japonicus TaxID=34305 RepID=UPI0025864524|nr:uncharacterized protein LOC130737628 [Lotus japonicus]
MIEQKNLVLQKAIPNPSNRGSGYYRNNPFNKVVTVESKSLGDKKTETGSSSSANTANVAPALRSGDYRQLSSAEMKEKREKRLCFRCDEPFSREHRCKNKHLRMVIMEEEEEEELAVPGEEDKSMKSLQLSRHSIAGFTSAKSWKVRGFINGQEVVILIDCGASHNFVSHELVASLQLHISPTASYTVEVGDGYKVRCQGKCEGLMVDIQGIQFQQEYYLFGLQGIDLVLGLEWLASLG